MRYTTLIGSQAAHVQGAGQDWLFVDCRFDIRDPQRGRRDYLVSHIPGAAYADLDRDMSGPAVPGRTGRRPLPEQESIVRFFSEMGIGAQTQVIAYDESSGAMAAARLWWLLKWAGHDAAAVLDGGLSAWTTAGLPTAPAYTGGHPRSFPVSGPR